MAAIATIASGHDHNRTQPQLYSLAESAFKRKSLLRTVAGCY